MIDLSDAGQSEAHTIAHLRATLESDKLSDNLLQRGEALLQRLNSPVRVAIIGLPGTGKTEMMNLMAGQRVVPDGVQFPSFELSHGETIKCVVADTSEAETEIAWPVDPNMDWSGLTMVRLEHPAQSAKNIALIEVVTDGTDEDLAMAAQWAAERTDIALWCTQDFGAAELAAWQGVPEVLKDHSFLVVTKADALVKEGTLAGKINTLSSIVEDEFHSLFPVATLQFLNAVDASGNVSPKIRAATGAAALIDEVLKHAEQGRQSDIDGAMYFLSRYGIEFDASDGDDAPADEAEPRAAVSSKDSKPGEKVEIAPIDAEWLDTSLEYLSRRAGEISLMDDVSDDLGANVIDQCSQTIDHLLTLAEEHPAADEATRTELEEASEMLILLSLEKGDEPAADAATLLLQISRDFGAAQAA